MTRRQRQRLEDILVAIEAIRHHLERGDLEDGLVFDAVRVRLIEIGEAVKSLPADVLAQVSRLPGSIPPTTASMMNSMRRSSGPPWCGRARCGLSPRTHDCGLGLGFQTPVSREGSSGLHPIHRGSPYINGPAMYTHNRCILTPSRSAVSILSGAGWWRPSMQSCLHQPSKRWSGRSLMGTSMP